MTAMEGYRSRLWMKNIASDAYGPLSIYLER
jgi:hypothetical protein